MPRQSLVAAMEAADISNNNHTINSSNTTTTAGGDGGDNSKSRTDGKPTSDNNSTGVSGASTADSAEVEGADEFCFICADPVEFWAVGPCNHRTCYLCNLRLRALYHTKACPYCKEDSETVIYTRDPETLFEELAAHRYKYHDEKLGLKFEQRRIHDLTMYALQFNCPYRSCNYADESGWGNLRKHIQSEHNMYLCELCVAHKKVFPHEHRIYTKARLKHHKRDGDTKGFTGHPQCEFCHIYFYDGDELFTHCREKHEQCFICVRSGTGRQVYYKNYMTLVDHFSKEHYICKHPACLEKKFIAFETKMDLQAHIVEEHSENLIGQRAKREARRVDIEFGSAPASGNDSGTSRQEARRDGESSSKGKSNRDSERAGRKRPTGFGQLSQAPSSEPQSTQSTNGSGGGAGGSLSQQQRQQQQHSASVKLDESQWPSLAAQQLTGSQQPSPKALSPEGRTPSSVNLAQSTASASAPADFQDLLKQVSMYFNHREQPVERFQSLTSTVIKGGMTPDDYISNCWLLFLTVPRKEPKAMFNKVVQQIVRQIDDEVRKKAFLTSVANHKARQQQFPALTSVTAAVGAPSSSSPASGNSVKSPRVLVIHSSRGQPGLPRSTRWATTASQGLATAVTSQVQQSSSTEDFPSLASGSSKQPRPSASIASSLGGSPGINSMRQTTVGSSDAGQRRREPNHSDFPELVSQTRSKIPPVNPIPAPGTWVTPSQRASPAPRRGQSNVPGQYRTPRDKKGKKTLFYVG